MPMAVVPTTSQTHQALPFAGQAMATDMMAKEAILAWFRGEFAAANAIIDALCSHLAQLSDGGSEYASVFTAIHRRRLNWIPVLQMQKYHSIADVTMELRKVPAPKKVEKDEITNEKEIAEVANQVEKIEARLDENMDGELKIEKPATENENGAVEDVLEDDDTPESEVTDTGSHGLLPACVNVDICDDHQDCESRPSQIKLTKGFSAKESIKGHMVNVVKGLKLYDDIFTSSELSKLKRFVSDLRSSGQSGELPGETYILFNQQVKGNRRELIQLGVPIFGQMREEEEGCHGLTSNIEPIPPFLDSVIDHLVQWHLIPEYKRPNGCIISFFEEGEHSQPFQKPPHLDHPISTLFLSESTMVFGHSLVSDNDGNYKGPLMLTLKEGSLLVMRGNSGDTARHVICPAPTRRVSITFFRLRPGCSDQRQSPENSPPASFAVAQRLINGTPNAYKPMAVMPAWGVLHAPVVMLAPVPPLPTSPSKLPPGGTGVFLPWTNGSRKHTKHLPPRAQKGRLRVAESSSEPGIIV